MAGHFLVWITTNRNARNLRKRQRNIQQGYLEDGQLIRKMKHGGPVAAVAVRNDGKRFASAGLNNVAKLWESSEGKEIAELRGDRYARELQTARERELNFSTNELAYRKSALQTAT